jgi:hypothetical protein
MPKPKPSTTQIESLEEPIHALRKLIEKVRYPTIKKEE